MPSPSWAASGRPSELRGVGATWRRTALALATEHNFLSYRQTAQMDVAFLTFVQGKEGVAVDLVTQHLQGFVDMGRNRCASCFQLRGDDAPMLTCDGCRVVRCVYAATPVLCGRDWHASRGVADMKA